MPKALDLTGQRFNRLTVLKRVENSRNGKSQWLCKCDCGNETIVIGSHLKNGNTKSCGCLDKELIAKRNEESAKDLIGMQFERLTVIAREESKFGKARWLCRCECGNEVVVYGSDLKDGTTKSCGCLKNEMATKRLQDLNETQKGENHPMYGKQHGDMARKKISDARFGTHMSEETKQKLRESMMGERNPSWQGGVSIIESHLRKFTKDWDRQVRISQNKKCDITGKTCTQQNSTVHHLFPFKLVVRQAHEVNNIEVKSQILDYTKEELKLLEDYVKTWHSNNIDKGVLLLKTIHREFHALQGGSQVETNEQDYLDFKQLKQNTQDTNIA